jgi:hypothetical protein
MAKAKSKKQVDEPEDKTRAGERAESKKLLERIRDRFKVMTDADDDNRRLALDDLKFAHEPGAQWDQALKKERGDRPCYEFNKLRITIKRVINHIRANRPAGKVRAVEDGDKDTADIYDGLNRNIWNVSDADTVVDYAAEYVVAGGMGAWRVTTEYSDDTAFEQDIFIRPIKNPFCLYADPTASDPFKRDADDWILTEKISKKAYETRYPKAKRVSFEDVEFDDDTDWEDDETVRICEYWYKKAYDKTLYLLPTGETVDKLPHGVKPVRERQVKCPKIMMVIASGDAILEGPTEWAGKMFPFVMVHGEWRVIDGKVQWHGLTRFSKDAQRAYNASRTAINETIALAPQAKWLMTPEQYLGLEKHIADAHKQNIPVMFYNNQPGAQQPTRLGGPEVPVALIQEAGMASEDIKATSGIFDASLGNQSNETSGIAIRSRQEQGEIATYNYMDNISKGVRITDEIVLDLIPHIIDTTRAIRILGADGGEKYVKVNTPVQDPQTGEITVMNDLTRGKYDVTVTSGPSFSTQRQEAAEVYTAIGQAVPQLWAVAGDLVVKAMDLPYSEQIADRLKAILPPQIQQQMSEGKPIPPEVQAVMQQAEQAMAIVQQQSQLVQQAAQEVEQSKAESDKAKAEVQTEIANLKTAQAQFEAKVAKEVANLVQREAQLSIQQSQIENQSLKVEHERGSLEQERGKVVLADEASQAIENIKELAADFSNVAFAMADRLDPPKPEKPKTRRQVSLKRNGPDLVGQIDEVDEAGNVVSTRGAKMSRQGDELIAAIEQLGDDGQIAGVKEARLKRVNGNLVGTA